jgi:enediyne biosynthesis protein E4
MLLALLQSQPPPIFQDQTVAVGLSLAGDQACWIDYDNDGWVDLCAGGTLWKNNQGKSFTKIFDPGLVIAADFDNDGYPDLFSWSQLKLWHNDAGKGFTEFKLPALPPTSSRGACWGDFDGDGYVDLYIGGFEDWEKQITYPSMILMNQGGKSFKLAWADAKYRSRGVTACDFNRDGALDVYASDYRLQPNELWLNDGHGKFKDVASDFNALATSPGFDGGHSIGACWGDFDNDGEFDLFAGNFAHRDDRGDQPKSRFLRNLGRKAGYKFEDMGTCGVFYQESYASPAAGDFDNDGNLDLYFTTVYGVASFSRPNHAVLFRNNGNFVFTDSTAAAGVADQPPTYQAAWADFNHDGQLDLVTGGHLYVNRGNKNRWLEVRLVGDGRVVNRSAIGAQVRIKVGHKSYARQVEAGTGEGNQNDLTLHFGFGANTGSVSLEVSWPNGRTTRLGNVATNRIIDVPYKG